MNKYKLKSFMALKGDTNRDLASYLNLANQTISQKLNGKSEFTQGEINMMIKRYSMTPCDVINIFFD